VVRRCARQSLAKLMEWTVSKRRSCGGKDIILSLISSPTHEVFSGSLMRQIPNESNWRSDAKGHLGLELFPLGRTLGLEFAF
jgi:hypothetical protein